MKKKLTYLAALLLILAGYYFLGGADQTDHGLAGEQATGAARTAGAQASADALAQTAGAGTIIGLEIPFMADDVDIIEHMGYTVSYNQEYRIPNWVAYELQDSELYGDLDRAEKFSPDPEFKGRQAYDSDYSGSGWDRGHMAPAGDMKWSSQAMQESFYLTNVCPQNHNLNAGVWNDLEKQVRREAKYYGKLWVVSGPIVGSNRHGRIGSNRVMVPDSFFKALLAKNRDGKYVSVGFVFPNEAGDNGMASYAMTVNELEKLIGMDLFYNLDHAVQEQVEDSIDLWTDWRIR